MVLFHIFVVEDKVKDQLEAANPEPVIEEVVSGFSLNPKTPIEYTTCQKFGIRCFSLDLCSQDLANLAPRKPDWYKPSIFIYKMQSCIM